MVEPKTFSDEVLPSQLLEKCKDFLESEDETNETVKSLSEHLKKIMETPDQTDGDFLIETASLIALYRFVTSQRMPLRHLLPQGAAGRVLEQESDGVECTILGWSVLEAALRYRASLMTPWDRLVKEVKN